MQASSPRQGGGTAEGTYNYRFISYTHVKHAAVIQLCIDKQINLMFTAEQLIFSKFESVENGRISKHN